jgi:hypothetical protein
MENKAPRLEDTQKTFNNMDEALDAIYYESTRLLSMGSANSEMTQGLDLIAALARYKMDIRTNTEQGRESLDRQFPNDH